MTLDRQLGSRVKGDTGDTGNVDEAVDIVESEQNASFQVFTMAVVERPGSSNTRLLTAWKRLASKVKVQREEQRKAHDSPG